MRNLCAALVIIPLGCGSVKDPGGGNAPDAGGDTDDTTAPAVIATTPADGSTGASLVGPIELMMSEPLDPASVVDGAITVVDHTGATIDGAVTWDDNRDAIVFTPATLLTRDRDFTVTLGAVRDPAGNQADAFELGFTTLVNTSELGLVYRDGGIYQILAYHLDGAGRSDDLIRYNDPGLDGTWQTSDDVGSARTAYARTGRELQSYTQYADPGLDGVFGTSDDVIDTVNLYARDGLGRTLTATVVEGAGTDATWGTTDDVIRSYIAYTYDGDSSRTASFTSFMGPGADATWHTGDDELDYRNIYEYVDGQLMAAPRSRDPGVDGVWGNGDDELDWYDAYVYDGDGNRVRQIRYNGAGADGVWRTADDVISYYYAYEYQTDTRRTYYYASAGADATWQTGDDVASALTVLELDDHGQVLRTRYYNDNTGATEDVADLSYHTVNTYAATGATTTSRNYNGAGVDGTWFTSDDVLSNEYTYDTTH